MEVGLVNNGLSVRTDVVHIITLFKRSCSTRPRRCLYACLYNKDIAHIVAIAEQRCAQLHMLYPVRGKIHKISLRNNNDN